ncbi:GL25281 [Drosophila persimilis]|uniref:GL25281 n=1 Tax=Drosophila persimilis TaxID=7234 RepID=B4GRW9_DROPE|nr:GL25281 [Drosophila persimilis]
MASRRRLQLLLLLVLLVLQLIGTTPASRSLSVNGNNIWRRVRLVTSQESDRNAYQVLKPSSRNSTSTSTSKSTTTSPSTTSTSTTSTPTSTAIPPHSQRSAKQLDLNFPGSNVSNAARLEMSTEFFVVPTLTASSTTSSSSSTTSTPTRSLGARARSASTPRDSQGNSSGHGHSHGHGHGHGTPPSIVSTHLPFAGLWKEPWVVPVLVLATLTMLMMAAFEIFVLFKAWRTSLSRRHLFLGQMLLLGLFACASLGAIITAQLTLLSCGAIRFGVGVAYALVFAALLVKCVFLISLNGGVYLPAPYQGLLLLCTPPSVPVMGQRISSSTTVPSQTKLLERCFYPTSYNHAGRNARRSTRELRRFSELLFSLIYIVFLIVFIAVLAIKSRGIRDNYREATYIGLAIGGAIPIWLGWMLCGLAVAERHKDACIAFGLVATSATVFLVMFMPKGRQLAAMGKEGLYVEDREEQFSSLSRAGSGYSPSFFHFKPIKYGVMSGCGIPNSASNTGQGLSSKHCSSANNGGGKSVSISIEP